MAAAAYSLGRRVLSGDLLRAQAIGQLHRDHGMGVGSAADYINTLRCMLQGQQYTRTMNSEATRLFLDSIRSDFGEDVARGALRSVRSHVDYYDRLGHGRLAAVRDICDRFEGDLAAGTGPLAEFKLAVESSRRLSAHQRTAEMARYPVKPVAVVTTTTVFRRNPHVVVAVLERAKGICEARGESAPFMRASTGEPYLEVHHKVTLATGGEDTVDNAIALCPNCHRRAHFG